MKGEMAEPPAKTTKIPINNKMKIIGANHHLFLDFMYNHRSFKNSI
jgi:hypothetical protein